MPLVVLADALPTGLTTDPDWSASALLGGVSFGMAGTAGAVAAVIVLALLLLHQARCWSAANQNLATRH